MILSTKEDASMSAFASDSMTREADFDRKFCDLDEEVNFPSNTLKPFRSIFYLAPLVYFPLYRIKIFVSVKDKGKKKKAKSPSSASDEVLRQAEAPHFLHSTWSGAQPVATPPIRNSKDGSGPAELAGKSPRVKSIKNKSVKQVLNFLLPLLQVFTYLSPYLTMRSFGCY